MPLCCTRPQVLPGQPNTAARCYQHHQQHPLSPRACAFGADGGCCAAAQAVEQVRAVCVPACTLSIPCAKVVWGSADAILVGLLVVSPLVCDATRAHRVITAWPPLLSPRNFMRVTRVSRCLQVLSLSTARPGMRASYLGGSTHRHAPLCLIPPMHSVMRTDCGCPCPAGLGGWVGVCGVCMCVFH